MQLLETLGKCPVCSFPTGSKNKRDDAFDIRGGREYLSPIADTAKIALDDLVAQMQSYQCSHCRALYLEPWLNPYARSRTFVTGHPIHNAGWRNLQQWTERGLIPEIPGGFESLYKEVQTRVGNFNSYVEFGCPFQGLILGLAPYEDSELLTRTSASQFTMPTTRARHRLLPPLYWYLKLSSYIFRLSQFLTVVRKTRDRIRRRYQRSASVFRLPERTLFVPLSTSRFWSTNCNMYGTSCTALVSRFSNVTVSSRSEIMKVEAHHYDLAGLFNVLDHQDDPLKLLKEVLHVSKLVVCMSHNMPFSCQHHYGLGKEFFLNLPSIIDGCDVESIGGDDGADCLFLITSQPQAR